MCTVWLSSEFSREMFPLSSGVHSVNKDAEAFMFCFSATPHPAAWRGTKELKMAMTLWRHGGDPSPHPDVGDSRCVELQASLLLPAPVREERLQEEVTNAQPLADCQLRREPERVPLELAEFVSGIDVQPRSVHVKHTWGNWTNWLILCVTWHTKGRNRERLFTFPLLLQGVLGGAFPVYSSYQWHQVIVIDFEVSVALRTRLPQVGVQKLSPVVQILLWQLEIELE